MDLMTDQDQSGVPAEADTGDSDDQAGSGTSSGADLEAEVGKAAKKQQRERISLDSFTDPEARKLAERLQAQAVTDYRKALEEGKSEDFVRKADFERQMRAEMRKMKAEQEAIVAFREHLADLGIKRGTEDYDKFTEEANSGFYDKSKLADRALVERIAKQAQIGAFRPKQVLPEGGVPYVPTSGTPVRVDKAGKQVVGDADEILADMTASLRNHRQ